MNAVHGEFLRPQISNENIENMLIRLDEILNPFNK